jgi:putative resolvase
MHLSIGQAATLLGVSISTLRRWEREGFLLPAFRTFGGHRRFSLDKLETVFSKDKQCLDPVNARVLAYARVSSHDQKKDLETQKEKLEAYCRQHFDSFEIIADLGSGLSAPSKAWHFQRVKISPKQAVEPLHLESSLGFGWATYPTKRRQSYMQAVTKVKRLAS